MTAELLAGLSASEAGDLLALGSRVVLSPGEELFHLGGQADNLYLVRRGRLKLTLPMQVRGRDQDVLVEERSPGQAVGWSALIPPYKFTLTAAAPLETEVIALPRGLLQEYFAANPQVGYLVSLNVASVIGQRLHLFQTMWLREMQRTVELRCA
jgi:CRP/FNR family cyclic AMP-dependent transcriptional regulator